VPRPPSQDQGTDSESLVHAMFMPLPEQVVEVVEDPPELGGELDGAGVSTTGGVLDAEAVDAGGDAGGATASLFATTTGVGAAPMLV
jgi:hypothetical protein